jgi:hypothetical protein
MLRNFYDLAYLSTVLSFLVAIIYIWLLAIRTKVRFQHRTGSLAVARYVYGIVWRTTVVQLFVSVFFLYQGILLLLPPEPMPNRLGNIIGRLIVSIIILCILGAFGIWDTTITDSNDKLQEDYEADVREAVKQIIVFPGKPDGRSV